MTSCGERLLVAMSALVYRRLELDAGNTRSDVIDQAQLMQSNLETISKLERKYREYTGELRRRYPAPDVIAVTEVEEARQVSRTGQGDCAEMREGQGIMNVLRSLWGRHSSQKREPQPLKQLGFDAG